MADKNIGSIATDAFTRIQEVDSAVSGDMVDLASGAVIALGNALNQSLSPAFDEKHEQALIDLTACYALQRQAGKGVDFGYSLGEFSVNKGGQTGEGIQIEFLLNRVNEAIKHIGRKITYYKAFG